MVIDAWRYTHGWECQEHLVAYDSVRQTELMHSVHKEKYAFGLLVTFFVERKGII